VYAFIFAPYDGSNFFLTFLQKLLKVLGEKFSAGLKGPTE